LLWLHLTDRDEGIRQLLAATESLVLRQSVEAKRDA
jgi:hypothetical protein